MPASAPHDPQRRGFVKLKEQLPMIGLIALLLVLALAIWSRISVSKMPPLYDGLSYAQKANYFWAAVRQGYWFDPLNIEPVIRPPGTVVFSYPLGWTQDFRTYYFNIIYFPIAIFVAALWLIGRPFCRNIAETGVLAALCATLATLPIFYHLEPNPQIADPINLGQMDAAFAAVAGLAAALTIRGVWELRLSWTVAGIAAGAFSALIKPAGFV